MRRTLQVIGLAALLFVWADTLLALHGAHPLPARIPLHFDSAGHANGWGTPGMLWFMPVVVTVVYALMSWVTRHPQAFNYPVRVTPANRPCLQNLTLTLIAWIQAEIACLFAWIQYATIASARRGGSTLSPRVIFAAILVVWITIGWYVVTMVRTARTPART